MENKRNKIKQFKINDKKSRIYVRLAVRGASMQNDAIIQIFCLQIYI